MTHTLHREGIKKDSKDYVFLAMVEGNDPQKLENLSELFKIILKHKPINDQLPQIYKRTKIGMAVFDKRDAMVKALQEIKDRELGVSVVVSGLFSDIGEDCRKLGLPMHTVNYSLGVWGKREKLPDPKVTEITTMCGHGLVSFNLVQSLVKEVRRGKKSLEEAADILAKPCVCGVVNTIRARELLQAMV
jgi:hypothetical protein